MIQQLHSLILTPKNRKYVSTEGLYTNVHSSLIQRGQKLEITQICISRWMDKQTVGPYSVVQRKTLLTPTAALENPPHTALGQRSRAERTHNVSNSTYMQFNLGWQKADQWFPGAEAGEDTDGERVWWKFLVEWMLALQLDQLVAIQVLMFSKALMCTLRVYAFCLM